MSVINYPNIYETTYPFSTKFFWSNKKFMKLILITNSKGDLNFLSKKTEDVDIQEQNEFCFHK